MILSYSKLRFVNLILSGEKRHTIREDPHRRWRIGMSIQHWYGSPRNPSKAPFFFGDGECMNIEEIMIARAPSSSTGMSIIINGKLLPDFYHEILATNDGLTITEFREWFVPEENPRFFGRILHFYDSSYEQVI